MNTVMVIWSAAAGAGLMLAVLHFFVWFRDRRAWASLVFSLSAVFVVLTALCELNMMLVQTPVDFGFWLRWIHVPGFLAITGTMIFVRLFLGTGRIWLIALTVTLRLISLVLNFSFHPNINYREIRSLHFIPFLGEKVAVAGDAIPNRWMWLAQACFLLWFIFAVDAGVKLWRGGDADKRRRAVFVGGAMALFILLGTGHTVLALNGVIRSPLLPSLAFLFIIFAMGYELSRDVLRAAQLSRDLRASEAAFQQQREQLSHTLRRATLNQMASSLAHELNQPLTAVVNNAGAGQRMISRGIADTAQLEEILADIKADAHRASEVIRSIRGMARRSADSREKVNVNDLVASVRRMITAEARARGCVVVEELAPSLPPVEANTVQIQQVLLNLLMNAFDASDMAGAVARRVIVRTEAEGESSICVSVRDVGPGLPPDGAEKLFEPFHTTKANGMGMGLAIVRSIVEVHGGSVGANNAEGGGACFHFRLPAVKGATA